MSAHATFLAALGMAAGIAGVVCANTSGAGFVLQRAGLAAAAETTSGTLRALACLFFGLSFLFALLASAELWLGRGGTEGSPGAAYPSAWGALWVYAVLLVIEWRVAGLSGVGRRVLVGIGLGGMGVLALGIGFEVWMQLAALPMPACENGSPVIEATGVSAAAALGLCLVPIAGPALRLLPAEDLPLSTVAASVAIAAWMQPVLPALGWLPTAVGGGAPLAIVLFAALWCLVRSIGRGGKATAFGLAAYFILGVGGGVALGTV